MDTEQSDLEPESEEQIGSVDLEASVEAVEALETHEAEHEEEAPTGGHEGGTEVASLSSTSEAQMGGKTASASDQAMGALAPAGGKKKAAPKKTPRQLLDEQRAAQMKERKKLRSQGKDWTAEQLAKLLKDSGAQGLIQALSKSHTAQGVAMLKTSGSWDKVLAALPKGKLNRATRDAVRYMVLDDTIGVDDAKKLFEIRFNHAATDGSAAWTMDNLKVVWQQLDLLPESDVSKATVLTTFEAIAGGGGFGPSWEAPDTINSIQLGQDTGGDVVQLEHTVRHEVGHGVHAEIPGPINDWLQKDMAFWFVGFDDFVTALGGYPATFNAPGHGAVPVDAAWQGYLLSLVEGYTGSGSWDPAKATPDAGADPNGQAAWAAMPAGVKNGCAQSVSYWYSNWENFAKKGNTRYFLNHWYHRAFSIGPVAAEAIRATGDDYTAMSEKEFFANCYAEYFANPDGIKDHTKWGGKLPAPVKGFFDSVIVARHPYDKFKANQNKKSPRATK
jgi:hypothetical protein